MRLVGVLVVCAALAGCFSPKYGSGDLQCAPSGACPAGLSCIAGRCYAPGMAPDLAAPPTVAADLGQANDLTMPTTTGDMPPPAPPDLSGPPQTPPAAAWISSGGGTAVGSTSGAELNMSIGGSFILGDVTSSSGAEATYGYFSSDTIQ